MKRAKFLLAIILCALLVTCAFTTLGAYAVDVAGTVTLKTDDVYAGWGSEFTTTVYAEAGSNLAGITMTLSWDENVVSLVSATAKVGIANKRANSVILSYAGSANAEERLDILELTFKVNDQIASGTTKNWLKKVVGDEVEDECFTIIDWDFADLEVVTDFGDIVVRKIGDAYDNRGDGKINARDASRILQHVARIKSIPTNELVYANAYEDYNSDGTPKINARDASAILQYVARIRDTLGNRRDVTFYDKDCAVILARSVKSGEGVKNIPAIPEVSGKTGVWSASSSEYVEVDLTAITENTKVYAYYSGSTHVHDYVTTVIEPTCEEQGYTEYACECGDSYIADYVSALGHSYGDWVSNGNDTHTKTCANNNAHRVTENCHGGTASCENKAICSDCGSEWGDIKIVFTVEGNTITGLTQYGKTLSEIVIPETIDGLEITRIGEDAFSDYGSFTSVVIPDSVTSIGYNAFYNCDSLTSVTIGNGVTHIGSSAFESCDVLENVTMGNSVAWISGSVFSGCSILKKIDIPDSVKIISDNAFDNTNLEYNIKDGLKYLGNEKNPYLYLRDCVSNGSNVVSIDDNCRIVHSMAFYYSQRLEYNVKDGLKYLGNEKNPYMYLSHAVDENISTANIDENCRWIANGAFYDTNIRNIVIPDSVLSIGSEAFVLTNLKSATIGNNVISIGSDAFTCCDSLTSIVIPDSVISMGSYVFDSCSALTIYCEAESKPSGWSSYWNGSNRPVVWGYEKEFTLTIVYGNGQNNKVINQKAGAAIETIADPVREGYKFLGWDKTIPTTMPAQNMTITAQWELIHVHDYETTVIEPTCEEQGYTEYACECGDSYIADYVSALGHSYGDWVSNGNDTHTKTCANNNAHRVTENCHGGTASCEDKAVCVDCNTEYGTALGHDYEAMVFAPTCEEQGYTYYECSVCGDNYKDNYVDATGSVGLGYSINSDGTTCTVTDIGTCTDTDIVIPKTIGGYTVTAIADKAFENQSQITVLTIPSTVTSIGTRVFYGCTGLKDITIPQSVTSIGTQIFYKSGVETVYYNSTYGSEENPFLNVTNIKKVAFGGRYVPSYALYQNQSVKEVEITSSVTSIGYEALYGCTSLETIEIPDSVTSIGSSAFSDCSALKDVYYEGDVEGWLSIDFYGSGSNPASNGANLYLGGELVTDIVIPNGVTSIGYAFYNCTSLETIEIPDSITTISSSTFYGCTSLVSVNIPDSVTSIGSSAFYNCTSLEAIEIPDSITTISSSTFYGCTSLVSVNIPDSVTRIGYEAFYNCSSLETIEIPDSVTSIGGYAFENCDSLTSIVIPDSVTIIEKKAFEYCTSLTSVTIGDSVTSIGSSAFLNCDSLISIVIPDSVTSIGDYAFSNCDSLTSVTIGNSVTSIGVCSFLCCTSLETIEIPDSVTSIGDWAFNSCSSLTSIKYTGTMSEYEAISKGSDWAYGVRARQVQCSDGNCYT